MGNLPQGVEPVLNHYIQLLAQRMPGRVEGLYVTGSVALDDYRPNKSDLDFLAFSPKPFSLEELILLKGIHQEIRENHRKPAMNGYYLIWDDIGKSADFVHPIGVDAGRLNTGVGFELDAFTWLELSRFSIPIMGHAVDIQNDPKEVVTTLRKNISSYWKWWKVRHSGLLGIRPIALLLIPRLTEWAVLGTARQYYTLLTGKIASKLEAGRFCLERLPEEYHWILEEAIAIRQNKRRFLSPSFKRKRATLSFIDFITEQYNVTYSELFE